MIKCFAGFAVSRPPAKKSNSRFLLFSLFFDPVYFSVFVVTKRSRAVTGLPGEPDGAGPGGRWDNLLYLHVLDFEIDNL
ncbi:MAG: hypothetical protein H0Z39_10560 [Peptococcaceae bacterium]|nr:hypothetical protein [Peptococcaceae bacterium]